MRRPVLQAGRKRAGSLPVAWIFCAAALAAASCASPPAPGPDLGHAVTTLAQRRDEYRAKLARLRAYAAERGWDAFVLGTPRNTAWLAAGGTISSAGTSPVRIAVTRDRVLLVGPQEDLGRIIEEELPSPEVQAVDYLWYEDGDRVLREALSGARFASDTPVEGAVDVEDPVAVRAPLLRAELARYRWLGEATVGALGEVTRDLRPGVTEEAIRNRICDRLWARGIEPHAVHVGSDERIRLYPNPVATSKPVRGLLLIHVRARKWGLVAATSRMIAFGPPPVDVREDVLACARIQAIIRRAMHPGVPNRDLFQIMREAYRSVDRPEAWKQRPQGGPAGYHDLRNAVTGDTEAPILPGQAQAWGPQVGFARCEDTVYVASDGSIEVLTPLGAWPPLEVEESGTRCVVPAILVLR